MCLTVQLQNSSKGVVIEVVHVRHSNLISDYLSVPVNSSRVLWAAPGSPTSTLAVGTSITAAFIAVLPAALTVAMPQALLWTALTPSQLEGSGVQGEGGRVPPYWVP